MHTVLTLIESNDPRYHPWEAFVSAYHGDSAPQEEGGWFSLEVGSDDAPDDTERFQVHVCTHAGAAALRKRPGRSRYVITPSFTPAAIVTALEKHLAQASGRSWSEIRESLRKSMWWEREDLRETSKLYS